jgi:N-methylhydantoinase B
LPVKLPDSSSATFDGIIRSHEVDFSRIAPGPWDGKVQSYIPPQRLRIDPSVQFHEEFTQDLDPVTYEVLRWRFWNINVEHNLTIKRISNNMIVCYMDDYNTWLLTENGDSLLGGPSVQYFTGMADLSVKYTLEHRSIDGGVQDGDVFLHNDPFIASAHQLDVATYAPMYWDGQLFCWIFNAAHQVDLGSPTPGSFVTDAVDIYDEPTPWAPIKLYDRGVRQDATWDAFARQSRMPQSVTLQLRGQVSGINTVKRLMTQVLDEYGPQVVKGVMRRIIADASQAVSSRLLTVPDGRWEESYFVGTAGQLRRVRTVMTKVADQLTLTNDGTDEQGGPGNGTYNSFRSGMLSAGGAQLAWDQMYCPAGVLNHLRFEPVPGLLTTANYPAAVTVVTMSIVSMYHSSQLLSRMLESGPRPLLARVNATGALSSGQASFVSGLNLEGQFAVGLVGDGAVGALGAFGDRDGTDTGGHWWWPRASSGNIEELETSIGPVLFLYRKELPDSGGPGEFRGGNAVTTAFVPHKALTLDHIILGGDPAINTSPGLAGGFPGRTGLWLGSEKLALNGGGDGFRLPATRSEIDQAATLRRIKSNTTASLGLDAVYVNEAGGGAGFGDSIERDPESVLNDILRRQVSVSLAQTLYGVVVSGDVIDLAATDTRRAAIRAERRAKSDEPVMPAPADVVLHEVQPFGYGIALGVTGAGDRMWACRRCSHALTYASLPFRDGCRLWQCLPSEVEGFYVDHREFFPDVGYAFRRWFCPDCSAQLAAEFCLTDDPPANDFQPLAGTKTSATSGGSHE